VTDPRNPTHDPVLALKLAVADVNAERRELCAARFRSRQAPNAERDARIDLLTKQHDALSAQLRETLKETK
jgi:hypothetical protein